MLSTQCTHDGIGRLVGIGYSIQSILYQFVHRRNIFVTRTAALAGHTTVNDIDRLGVQVLAHLQVFMIADSVCRAIRPDIPEMLTFGNIAYRFTPDGIGSGRVSFHKAASRKTDKLRLQSGN